MRRATIMVSCAICTPRSALAPTVLLKEKADHLGDKCLRLQAFRESTTAPMVISMVPANA